MINHMVTSLIMVHSQPTTSDFMEKKWVLDAMKCSEDTGISRHSSYLNEATAQYRRYKTAF